MAKPRKELYEGMYIISASLSEESRKKAFEKITEGILEKGGEVHKVHERGRIRLAYEIDGKREGFYFVVYFSSLTSSISQLWKDYQLHEDLIRFTTMRTDAVLETLEFKPIKPQV
ncbi:MAG TPA: 30S ribosomal protein S6 [Chlamydiales bacterium]|nr:30S ribosomal protein S6 [Chlamydiales bacterium]